MLLHACMHLKKHKYNISIRILIYNLIYFVKANCRAKMQTYVHVIVCGKHAENYIYMCIPCAFKCHWLYMHVSSIEVYIFCMFELKEFVGFIVILYYILLTMKTLDFSKTIFDFFVLPVFYRFCRCNIHVNDRDWKVYVKNV